MKSFSILQDSFASLFTLQTFYFKRHITPLLGAALLLLAVQPGVSWAQAADDVNCRKCVDNSDIAKNSITSSRIKNGTIKRADIADGAITVDKLSAGAQLALDGDSCTAIQGSGSATISCEDGSMASVYDGDSVTGNNPGDMQYWDGFDWIVIPAATSDTTLHSCGGVPTWGQCPSYLAVAYINIDSTDGFNAAEGDVLILGLWDADRDGSVSPGDQVRYGSYPTQLYTTDSAPFLTPEPQEVSSVLSTTPQKINVELADGTQYTFHHNATTEGVSEWRAGTTLLQFEDQFSTIGSTLGFDFLVYYTDSHGAPAGDSFENSLQFTVTDDAFVDVDILTFP